MTVGQPVSAALHQLAKVGHGDTQGVHVDAGKACQVAKKLEYLNAIELMTQVQAMDFMEEGELKHSPVIQAEFVLFP